MKTNTFTEQNRLNCHCVIRRLHQEYEQDIQNWKKQIQETACRLPAWKTALLQKAQEELNGNHILPGTGGHPFFVGSPPNWKELPVSDKEYLWSLNRMAHWNDFILAYYLTGETRYGEKIKEEAINWIQECPPPKLTSDPVRAEQIFSGVSPWRTLEVGTRMFETWPNAIKFLTLEGFMDESLLKAFSKSLQQHGEILYSISPLLWPEANHNHYLMENLGLLCLSHLFPQLAEAPKWEAHANRQLERCLYNQITEEGAQIEGCPSYHNLCMCYFGLWLAESQRNHLLPKDSIKERIRKGLDYSLSSFRPGGGSVPFGDSDTDYCAVRAAVLGYRVFEDPRWLIALKELSEPRKFLEEAAACVLEWGTAPVLEALDRTSGTAVCLPPRLSFQSHIQQVSYRTSWKKEALQIQFGCRMPGDNGHAHIDPQGFDFSALGRPMLCDPGRYTYDEAKERKLFKSAEMHNCLLLDHQDPYEYLSSWRFGPQHDGCILKAEEGPDCFWTQGIHTCYFPVIHQRLLSIIDSQFLLIWDEVSHMNKPHTVSIYFHVNQEQVFAHEKAKGYFTQNPEQKNLYLCSLSGLPSRVIPGMLSGRIDEMHPSSRILFEDSQAEGRKRYAVLAVPFQTACPEIQWRECNTTDILEFSVNGIWYQTLWDTETFTVKHM